MAASKVASGAGLVIGGKSVVADLAVGKEEAKDMAVGLAVSVRDKDKRNLYLAEVGPAKSTAPGDTRAVKHAQQRLPVALVSCSVCCLNVECDRPGLCPPTSGELLLSRMVRRMAADRASGSAGRRAPSRTGPLRPQRCRKQMLPGGKGEAPRCLHRMSLNLVLGPCRVFSFVASF